MQGFTSVTATATSAAAARVASVTLDRTCFSLLGQLHVGLGVSKSVGIYRGHFSLGGFDRSFRFALATRFSLVARAPAMTAFIGALAWPLAGR